MVRASYLPVAVFGLFLITLLAGCPQSPPADLDGFIRYEMERSHIPGLSAAVFDGGGMRWAQGYGWADIEHERAAGPDTLFQLASISKLVTATAAMQLVETGQLALDADVSTYLPFTIENPHHADIPITLRMLLTHTSSLLDNAGVYESLYTWGADSPITLMELIEGFYTPEGRWYREGDCFLREAPGTAWSYSNVGFALVGLLVELASGQPFDAYCNDHIFAPLGMTETSWFLRDLEPSHIAMPYEDASGPCSVAYRPYGQYGYPDYPSGQVRTSVAQFSRFMRAFLNGGTLDGATILQPETVEQMLSLQSPDLAPNQGLGWIRLVDEDGVVMVGHGGGEHGVLTMAWFCPEKAVGVIVLTNGDVNDLLMWRSMRRVSAINKIQERLFREAGVGTGD